jgi:putative holliday junction resolvase
MNILGVDYGQKRIGLAWVQEGLDVVLPYGIIDNKTWQIDLSKLIQDEGVQKVVIGNPLGMSGEDNENTKRVHEFVNELKGCVDVEVELYDERFSSQQADAMGGDASRDEKSAMVILQSYMCATKN